MCLESGTPTEVMLKLFYFSSGIPTCHDHTDRLYLKEQIPQNEIFFVLMNIVGKEF